MAYHIITYDKVLFLQCATCADDDVCVPQYSVAGKIEITCETDRKCTANQNNRLKNVLLYTLHHICIHYDWVSLTIVSD